MKPIPMTDYETGEPPRGQGRRIFCEPMSTYAQSGIRADGRPPNGDSADKHRHNYPGAMARPYPPGLLASEIAEAHRIWARLPSWRDVKRQLIAAGRRP